MKKLVTVLFTILLVLSASASTVNFWMTNFIAGGGPMTNGLKLSPVGPPVVNGIFMQYGRPTWLWPSAVTGMASTNLQTGVFQLEIYGFTFQRPIYFVVPNDSATYNVTSLITNGVAGVIGGLPYVSQITAGSGIDISPDGGQGNVTVNLAEQIPVGNPPTNAVLYTTNIVVMTRGEDTNHFIISGAGSTFVNGTNYTLKTRVGLVAVYTNDTGTADITEDPDDIDFFWTLRSTAGSILYGNSSGVVQFWTRINGLNPAPNQSLSGYGFSTNSFTNFISTIALPWAVSQTNLLFVSPLGNDYSAVRGDPTHPWKHVARAYTNMLYQFDVMAIQPGVFDERAELNNVMPQLPANCVIYGSGRGVSKIIGTQNSAIFRLGNSNRMEHLSLQACQIYTASASSCTNVVVNDVEANADGDVWVSDQGTSLAWDPFIIDCDFSGNSDKIAVLEHITATDQTNSRIYIINTRISGGPGADGDGMNRGNTTSDGVRFGQFVTLGTHVMVTGKTNSTFMGLSSQVSTSGTFTATGPGFIGPGPGITAINAANLSSGTLPGARFPATLPAVSGANLTSLNAGNISAGTLPLARGGTGASLSDPNANTLLGWDDTDNASAWLTIGSGLTYTHATHTLSSSGGGSGIPVNNGFGTNTFLQYPTLYGDSGPGNWISIVPSSGNIVSYATNDASGANRITNSDHSVVIGGLASIITNCSESVIFGGINNTNDSGGQAGILAGEFNMISGTSASDSVILGGRQNLMQGFQSAIIAGRQCYAVGNWTLAAGRRSRATHTGTFVWSDSQDVDNTDIGGDTFNVRAQNGSYFSDGLSANTVTNRSSAGGKLQYTDTNRKLIDVTIGSGLLFSGGTLSTNGQTVVSGGGLGYTIPIIAVASGNPSASTTYYVGMDSLVTLQTTYANTSIKIPKSGTIKAAFFKWSITTTGSGESVPFSIRINDTTDVSIQSVAMNAARVDVFSSSMSQAVSAGDTCALKMATPAWVSAPATIRGEGYVYIE